MQESNSEGARRVSAGPIWAVGIVAIVFVAALSVVLTFVIPRPYYILENDYDNGFYYNARAYYFGLPIHNVEHPGTPVIVLERLLMTSTTARLDHVQSFLNELYLVVGLAYCAGIGWFCLLVLRHFSAGVAALTLSSLAAWPSFLLHLNHYCTDSFVLAAGLVAVGAFWLILESFPHPQWGHVVLAGAACGLCMAIKLSFLPFVLTLEFTAAASLMRADARPPQKLLRVLGLWSATLGGFVLATLPVFHRLDETIIHTLLRRDARIASGAAGVVAENTRALLRESPAFVVLFIAVVVLVVITSVPQNRVGAGGGRVALDEAAGFDVAAGMMFVVLLSCSFVYGIACAAPDIYSVGNSLRNASPSALAIPFGILYIARVRRNGPRQGATLHVFQGPAMGVVALVVVVTSVAIHLTLRSRMIHDRLAAAAQTEARLGELGRQYGVVAFWGGVMNEAKFHFWGNYRYAQSYFDDELLAKFSGYSWLDLRDIRKLPPLNQGPNASASLSRGDASVPGEGTVGRPVWRRVLHGAYQWWLAMKQQRPVFPPQPLALYSGENRGIEVGLLAFPEDRAEVEVYRRFGWAEGDLKSKFESRVGPLRLWKERIAGIEWVFLAHQEEDGGARPSLAAGPPQ